MSIRDARIDIAYALSTTGSYIRNFWRWSSLPSEELWADSAEAYHAGELTKATERYWRACIFVSRLRERRSA